jgi:hypothetical protein
MRDALPAFVDDARPRTVVVYSMVAIAVAAVDVVPYTVARALVLSRISGCAWAGVNPVLSGPVSAQSTMILRCGRGSSRVRGVIE